MRIGILGAGAIGCFLGGKLAALGHDVVFVARETMKKELDEHGLTIVELGGANERKLQATTTTTDPNVLADCEVILVCVKSQHTTEVAASLVPIAGERSVIVSMQNGVRNADVLREALPGRKVLAAIVGFNVVAEGKGRFRHATSGPLVIEASDEPNAEALARALGAEVSHDVVGQQWAKLLVNLNNAVGALSDVPTRTLVLDARFRKVLAALIEEALGVLEHAGIRPSRVGPLPVRFFPRLLRLPDVLFRLVSRIQVKLDAEARSSMWQDLAKKKKTEVEHLNGEIVGLAAKHGTTAPMNRRIVELVHEAEARNEGSPRLDPETLWLEITRRR